ncbi:hypothetical protein [uncultured Campylobacter sp.]|uniref:hypothetical protein n=1 Tax=uncultured Campylobacter sp. TaxID=218934 RepID=UPI00260E23BB|nr:hypothetical protein [uncultured Campylobacter sp.]
MFLSFRRYMLHLFVCVIFENKKHIVRAHSMKNNKLIHTYEKTFESEEKLLGYVKTLVNDFQLYYISVFFDRQIQGIVPCVNSKDMSGYGVNPSNVFSINIANARLYSSINSINELKKKFEYCGGLDFAFSPLALLYYCISKEKNIENKLRLYIYRHSNCIAVMICKAKDICFGSFFDLSPKESALENKESTTVEKEENKEIEDANIENYDLDKLDNLLDGKLDDMQYTSSAKINLGDFSNDMQMCSYIFMSIKEFYNNPLYKGNFIDDIVLYDNENISNAVLSYIESELFLKPKLVQIDTLELMNELMRKELKV